MLNLELERPLAVIDVQSTGVDPERARIVSLAVLKIETDGTEHLRFVRVNPGLPIPPGATAIHGLDDDDVADSPPFRAYASALASHLDGCDLAGFGVERFGVPLLAAEFRRAGVEFSMAGRRVVDTMAIFHKKEPRDFDAAYEVFVGGEAPGRNDPESFVRASLDVLKGQLEAYEDIGATVEAIDEFLHPRPEGAIDERGMLVASDSGVAMVNFGKHRGRALREVASEEPDYLKWLYGQEDLPAPVREAVRDALESAAAGGSEAAS
jgi:DNA polymerase III subunit epsilon